MTAWPQPSCRQVTLGAAAACCRKGQVLRETPEFSSYQRVYSAIWPAVEELILHLQEICTQYAVPQAVMEMAQ